MVVFDKDYWTIGGPKFIEFGRLFDLNGWLNAHVKPGDLHIKTGKEEVLLFTASYPNQKNEYSTAYLHFVSHGVF
jgi:hypothetical protein